MHWKRLFLLSACMLMTSCSCLETGWRAFRDGDYDEAQVQAVRALSEDPRNPDVYRLIAETSLSRGLYDSAAKSAEFACSLDGGGEASERLLRRVYAAQKAWSSLCDAGLRASEKGYELSPEDVSAMEAGFRALSPRGSAYGCMAALEASGHPVTDGAHVKAAYASDLAGKGKNLEALALEDTIDDPAVKLLAASRRLYALQRGDEAGDRLRRYTESGAPDRESRLVSAADVCIDYNDWALAAELLSQIDDFRYRVKEGIALRRSFDTKGSERIFEAYFSSPDRNSAQTLEDIRILLKEGYGETAARAYETCGSCQKDEKMSRSAADLFHEYGVGAAAAACMMSVSQIHADDMAEQKDVFTWLMKHGYYPQGLIVSQRAADLGAKDDAFVTARLDAMLKNREILMFERESGRWIAQSPAPALNARTQVARLEMSRQAYHRAAEILGPLDDAGKLEKESLDIYILSLQKQHEFKKLDGVFDRYKKDITPLKRADYFNFSEAESEFRKSLQPLFSGNAADKISGYSALAIYFFDMKKDNAAGYSALEKAEGDVGHSAELYRRFVGILSSRLDLDTALKYALSWHRAYPQDISALEKTGELYLKKHCSEDASAYFDKYIQLSENKTKDILKIYQLYVSLGEKESGLIWAETAISRSGQGESPDYIETLAEIHADYLNRMESGNHEYRQLRRTVSDEYMKLLSLRPDKAVSYMYVLSGMKDYEHAVRACHAAVRNLDKGIEKSPYFMRECIVAGLRSGQDEKELRSMIGHCSKPKDIFDLVSVLDREHALYLGEEALKELLESESADTRAKAFGFLTDIALHDGDIKRIHSYMSEYEKLSERNSAARLKLAETAIMIHDWDAAHRHLTWLQAHRPDARDVLEAEMALARKASGHAGAQKLLASTFDAAEGVFHRLDWISQAFEKRGDNERALYYAEKAWDAESVRSDSMRLRLISLYLRAGKFDLNSEKIRAHFDALRNSKIWNVDCMKSLAETAYLSGYGAEAQLWMKEAVAMNPEHTGIKRRKLEMALDTDNIGQISVCLDSAIESPIAEVMAPLREIGAYMDIFEVIDRFESAGAYEMAASALLSVLPEFIEARGMVAARSRLIRYASVAPNYGRRINSVLAEMYLRGEMPCQAYPHVKNSGEADKWGRLAVLCPESGETIARDIRSYRDSLTRYGRNQFDRDMMAYLETGEMSDLNFAVRIGLDVTAFDLFRQQLASGHFLEAFSSLADNPVDMEHHLSVISIMIAENYISEAIDYAGKHLSEMSDQGQLAASASAILLGGKDPAFVRKITEKMPRSLVYLNENEILSIAAVEILGKWLHETPTSDIEDVLDVVLKCAATNPSRANSLLGQIESEILSRHDQISMRMLSSRLAIKHGLYGEALKSLDILKEIQPDSDYVSRLRSVVLVRLNRSEEASAELTEGARFSGKPMEYWEDVAKLHSDSDVLIRKQINAARLSMLPHQPVLLAEASVISMEQKDETGARQYALAARSAGGVGVVDILADGFERLGALDKLSPEVYAGTTGTELSVRARVLSASGDSKGASEQLTMAISRDSWPLRGYRAHVENEICAGNWPRVEQIVALMMANMPHASLSYAYRTIYELYRNRTEEAWNDYLESGKRSIGSRAAGLIAAHAIRAGQPEFARNVIHNEKKHASLQTEDFLSAFGGVLDLGMQDGDKCVSGGELARLGLAFLDENLSGAVKLVQNSEALRDRYVMLAQKSGNREWMNRLAAEILIQPEVAWMK